ncbi:sugar ABC transporter substrate-binding protein [Paenibacillus antibioticophila]|uniref:Sugar ABC transporter substrate-binding protein n=1 Tax=Paenibacillus antibioticophila TaxID=1274374 RepID=A0A920CHY7_9BACL|nr:sugar ABC transporter substrate-binding protein [Paenibacillus antibioticophila]GIO37719.1 sugar ABC transporter substrate-binding protein [Paenibacillus antibioticophila]
MSKKRVSLVLLSMVMMLSMLLSACGGSNESGNNAANQQSNTSNATGAQENNSDADAPKENVTLTAWIMPNSPKPDKDFMVAMEPYLQANPHVKINVTVLDWGSAWTKITTAATSGQGPDILQLGTTWVPAIAAMNGIEDLTSRVEEVGGEANYLPASWQTTKIDGQEEVYGVPWFVDARALFYRKDALEKVGLDPATAFKDWDTFRETLKKLNGVEIEGQKMTAFGVPGKNDWNVPHNIFPWIWAAGGNIFNEDNTEVTFNDKTALEGVMYYTGLANEGLVEKASLEKNSSQIESDFSDGKTAIMVSGAWMVKNFATPSEEGGVGEKTAAQNYGVAPLPAGPAGTSTFIGGSHLTIFKGSQHKDAAWDIIKYLSAEEAQLKYAQLSGQLPAQKVVMDSLVSDPGYKALVEATQYGRSYPAIPQWGPCETALVKYFGNIWDIVAGVSGTYSEQAIQQQLDDAANEVTAIINQ